MGRDIREREKEAKTVAGRPSNTRGRKQEQQLASRALKWVHFPVSGAHTLSVSSSLFFSRCCCCSGLSRNNLISFPFFSPLRLYRRLRIADFITGCPGLPFKFTFLFFFFCFPAAQRRNMGPGP